MAAKVNGMQTIKFLPIHEKKTKHTLHWFQNQMVVAYKRSTIKYKTFENVELEMDIAWCYYCFFFAAEVQTGFSFENTIKCSNNSRFSFPVFSRKNINLRSFFQFQSVIVFLFGDVGQITRKTALLTLRAHHWILLNRTFATLVRAKQLNEWIIIIIIE
jgi:hypothetical protein